MPKATKRLLEGIDALPWGQALRAEAERVVALAQESGDVDLEFEARMRLTANGVMSSVTDLALTNFAWCLAKHHEDPARFVGGPDPGDTIFWQLKWMPGLLLNSPVFDLAQIDESFADFEATYRAAGLPLSAVVTAKLERAVKVRDLDEALTWRARLEAMPRDDYSSCDACVPSNYVDVDLLAGEDAAAADRALAMWERGESCASEPETALAGVLVPLARLGRVDDAARAYEYVYSQCRNDRDDLGNVAECVAFAAATGNESIAFSLVERHLGWLAHDALSESEHFAATRAFALALTRFAGLGFGDVVVRGSDDPRLAFILPPADGARTVAELAEHFWDAASGLAARFDARNATDGFSRLLDGTRALVDTTHRVPLDTAEDAAFKPLLVRGATPTSARAWFSKAADHRWAGDNARVLEALERAIPGLEGVDLVRAYALQMSAADAVGDVGLEDRAHAAWLDAIRATYGEASAAFVVAVGEQPTPGHLAATVASSPGVEPSLIARGHARAAEALVSTGDADEERVTAALAQLDAAAAIVSSDLVAPETAAHAVPSALAFKAQLLGFLGRSDEALAALDVAVDAAPTRAMRGALAHLRGSVLGGAGDVEAAAASFDEAVTLLAAAGHGEYAQRVAAQAGAVWQDLGQADLAVARYAYALSLTRPGETPDAELSWRHALALVDTGDAEQAVPMLEQILAAETASGAAIETLADTHFHLGRAYDGAYDERAADEYQAAAALFASIDRHGASAVAGLRAGRELAYQGRHDEAQSVYGAALAALVVEPDPGLETDLQLGLGASLSAADDARWAAAMDRAVELARESDAPGVHARAAFMRVSMHDDHDDSARVVALGPEVTSLLLELGDPDRAAAVITWTAVALADLDRIDDALGLLERALSDTETYDLGNRIGLAERLIGLLKRAGRKDEAQRWKAARKAMVAELDEE